MFSFFAIYTSNKWISWNSILLLFDLAYYMVHVKFMVAIEESRIQDHYLQFNAIKSSFLSSYPHSCSSLVDTFIRPLYTEEDLYFSSYKLFNNYYLNRTSSIIPLSLFLSIYDVNIGGLIDRRIKLNMPGQNTHMLSRSRMKLCWIFSYHFVSYS